MDQEKDNFSSQQEIEKWLDELLAKPQVGEEIGPDEEAVSSVNLTHPSDAELERIIRETLSEDWDEPSEISQEPAPPQPADQFRDEEYRDAFGEEGEELEEVFRGMDKTQKKTVSGNTEQPSRRKGRPKKKKGYGLLGIPHLLATAIWVLIIVAIGVSLGRVLWVSAADVLAFGREDREVSITVTLADTQDMEALAEKLCDAGLIKYPQLFKLYTDLSHVVEKGKIQAGTYTLNTVYDYHALVNSMRKTASREEVTVMIPEGYTCAQLFNLLQEKGVCTVEELEDYAANGELDEYWFLEGVERGDKYCLEGYLFPDTYNFYTNDEPRRVLEKMLNDFDNRFGEVMRAKINTLNEYLADLMAQKGCSADYIAKNKITIREAVIVASMIEKETANNDESYTISSVIYNRLSDPAYLYLNIDATIYYALGGKVDPETGKTLPLTTADLQIDHPYNTYNHQGLIPGPISNPGLNSLNAALDPEDTDYYYYALNPSTGTHHFSKTYEEHLQFLASLGG